MNITEPGQWPAGIDVTVNVNFDVGTSISVAFTSDASSVDLSPNDIIVGSVKDAQEVSRMPIKSTTNE